ncbi:5'(3')-deoxyribonucleotidase [Palleronia marisminoris]|uniref:Putative 5'(3')-deoxyribonucleotidase n=1 Tax=Palleronia marisminoris TaxID=315423 RepID=A0A1Y5TEN9_9RHOB|nr:hypothetical protein [Palleronia marisminoris]SFH24039.1 5'(3')-deoxyribonucleotidase [Palleronia marisminoris]SLN58630.1 Putative 5'(3')-deoxyribonucleotidase [Palleronia marisminoris]
MRIAIDMDEVMTDTHAAKYALFASRGCAPSDEDLAGRKLSDLAPAEVTAAVECEMHKGFFFANLQPMDGAAEAVASLVERHEIFVATAAMDYPASIPHKIAWLAKHFPFIDPQNYVFCGNKGILQADILIDDSPRHFPGFSGKGVCFKALHNHGTEVALRLDHWSDAAELITELERQA